MTEPILHPCEDILGRFVEILIKKTSYASFPTNFNGSMTKIAPHPAKSFYVLRILLLPHYVKF